MVHQCVITDEFEKLSISPEEKQSDDAHSVFLLFKPKDVNATNKIRESKKCPAIRENRLKYVINLLIDYLNINSLRSKLVDLRESILELSLDYLVLSETKIDQSFPTAQFYKKVYEVRARRDRDKHGAD